jgi:hypothetical protein
VCYFQQIFDIIVVARFSLFDIKKKVAGSSAMDIAKK